MDHVDANHILNHYQHGFHERHSCETQLINSVEQLHHSLDLKKQVDCLILDFSKAFDKVAHQRLLYKFRHYGIRGNCLKWIESWLTCRSQAVVVEGERSKDVPVLSGVPQGTVLGPLMFILFINDIGENITSSIKLFADDCLLFREINSEQDAKDLQNDLNDVINWSKHWQMQ